MDTISKLKNIFERFFESPIDGFGPTTSSKEVQKWDSAAHVFLIMEIEESFAIQFSSAELTRLTNVGAIRDLLEAKVKA